MNETEAFCVIDIIQRFQRQLGQIADRQRNLLVITPYQGQIRFLKRTLAQYDHDQPSKIRVEVATADSCIGREADIVILSLVRSNTTGQLGFMEDDEKRALVMLSRETEYLFIFGDISLYSTSELWKNVFREFRRARSLETREIRDVHELKRSVDRLTKTNEQEI
ncbi:AAA domain containing Hypothetical protein [Phytophthora megakarya]|uniref:DNA2/NAM7 helicase-like C-terminal domain-containing protein n=1 Tax=Phytophthora megakarya TaxID=4795 RepID=A0A225W2U9_9STRA|nr:AAA domain containing Hypothetical protein [Phytophthora megakarya]